MKEETGEGGERGVGGLERVRRIEEGEEEGEGEGEGEEEEGERGIAGNQEDFQNDKR